RKWKARSWLFGARSSSSRFHLDDGIVASERRAVVAVVAAILDGQAHGLDKSYVFSDSPMNSNNAFVAGSSGRPRLSLSFVWLVSLAAKTLVGIPASFNTAARRCACAVVSG